MRHQTVDIDKLSADERLALIEELWESLRDDPSNVPLTGAQEAELHRRLDDLEADVAVGAPLGIPWNEILDRIRSRTR